MTGQDGEMSHASEVEGHRQEGGHVGQPGDRLETCLLAHSTQVWAFCIGCSRRLAGISRSPFFSPSWSEIFLFSSFLLHRALALGTGVLAAVTPVWGSEGLLQMFGACCHDSRLQSLAGHEH